MNDTILELLAQRGLNVVKISEVESGEAEYASPCPKCGGTDRLRVLMNDNNDADSGHWWCRSCHCSGNIEDFTRVFGEQPMGTVVVDSVWSFLKGFPAVAPENASPEKLREIIAHLIEYMEAAQAENARLVAAKGEALGMAVFYEDERERAQAAGIEAMRRAELAEARAEKLSEKLANSLKVNAASQMEAAVKLFAGLSAAMTGEEPPTDLAVCYCPHCGKQMKTLAEAALHDAVCEKHPAVIAAVAAEGERDWLAKTLAEDGCPYLAFWADFGSDMRPDWCICTDTADDGFDCTGDPKECWLKEAARKAVAGEVKA